MPDVADLKRNVVVPNVYCGLLDIHAYTEFCQRNRHNVSMLRTLDDVIQSDMREIAHKNGCLSARTAGDNILVIGSSPGNTVHACLGIIDCFSRRRVLEAAGLFEDRRGISVVMQDFTVSAGIAGGLRYSSLVVTQDGDISGTAMNTAARLQAFAAQISPDHSKVMVTSHVCSGYLKEQEKKQEYAEGFTFFNCGKIHFKGTSVSVCELLYSKQDIKKTEYQKRYTDLLEAAKSGRFSDRLISNAVQLIVDVLSTKPIPRLKLQENGSTQILTNETVVKLCKDAISRYESAQDHRTVSVELNRIVRILESASGFDPLVLTRFRQIVALYDQMTQEFETLQYEKIIENQTGLFSVKERTVIDRAERLERIRDTLIERGKRNNSIYSPLVLWNKIVSEYEGKWELDVYSGKK
jgi:class 3 adenylate cyclase